MNLDVMPFPDIFKFSLMEGTLFRIINFPQKEQIHIAVNTILYLNIT